MASSYISHGPGVTQELAIVSLKNCPLQVEFCCLSIDGVSKAILTELVRNY